MIIVIIIFAIAIIIIINVIILIVIESDLDAFVLKSCRFNSKYFEHIECSSSISFRSCCPVGRKAIELRENSAHDNIMDFVQISRRPPSFKHHTKRVR